MATSTMMHDNGLKDGKDGLFNGHKVVAMPISAFGGKSVVREVVSSRNTDYLSSPPYGRSRSRSIGRSSVSRSRDIVQDVYDRMGVNYTRGQTSIENLLEENKGIGSPSGNQDPTSPSSRGRAALSGDPTRPTSRGRPTTRRSEAYKPSKASYASPSVTSRGRSHSSDNERRSCTLSRGRMTACWPPNRSSAVVSSNSETSKSNVNSQSPEVDLAILPKSPQADQKERKKYAQQRRSMPQPLAPSRSFHGERKFRQSYPETRDDEREDEAVRHDEDVDARSTVSVKDRISVYGTSSRCSLPGERKFRQSYPETRDDEREDAEAAPHEEDVDARSTVSVKDRISVYGTPTRCSTSTRNVRRSYSSLFPKRDHHPPKMDIYIYGNSNASADGPGERDSILSTGSADASDALAQKNLVGDSKQRFSSANSLSHRSLKSGVANAFLAAISPNKPTVSTRVSTNVPIVEIPSGELHAGVESASLAASSVSGEDFTPKNCFQGNRTSSRLDKFSFTVHSKSNGHNNENTEKSIEEQIQAQVANTEKKFEAEIRRIEGRMDEEYRVRIEDLEKKTDKVNSILSKILSRKDRLEI